MHPLTHTHIIYFRYFAIFSPLYRHIIKIPNRNMYYVYLGQNFDFVFFRKSECECLNHHLLRSFAYHLSLFNNVDDFLLFLTRSLLDDFRA